jgi:hypothetical protein
MPHTSITNYDLYLFTEMIRQLPSRAAGKEYKVVGVALFLQILALPLLLICRQLPSQSCKVRFAVP